MMLVLLYGACLLVSVLVSGVAARTVLSTTLVFLISGAVIGQGGLGLVDLNADSEIVGALADLALFTVLFTDGGAPRAPRGQGSWLHAARALGIGMPLAFVGVTLLAHSSPGSTGSPPCWSVQCWLRPTRCSPRRSWAERTSQPGCAGC